MTVSTAGEQTFQPPREQMLSESAPPSTAVRRLLASHASISYRASLILSMSLLVATTGLAVSIFAFRGARAGTTGLAHSLFQEVSDHAVTKTRGFLLRAAPIAQGLGNLSELGLATGEPDRLARQLTAVLRANPGVSWVSYSDEAGSFVGSYRPNAESVRVNQSRIGADGRVSAVEHDVLDDGSWKLYRKEDDSGYDPRRRPFYQRAKSAGRVVWSPPYIFYDQAIPGVTCANPVYDVAGKLQGVLTVDFDLNTLSQFVQQLSVSPNSRLFIMSSDGILLAHPTLRPQIRVGERGRGELVRITELNDPLIQAFDAQLGPADRTTPGGADRARQFEFKHGGVDYYARATAFRVDGDIVWMVGAMAPKSDFLGAARQSISFAAAASLGAVLVAVTLAAFLARRVSGPILSLVSFMRGVGDGDLSGGANLGGAREFRQLSSALDRMIADLRDRTRLRSAMAVATEVQQALLPVEPPRVDGLDVYGFSTYCDETGGDYYDYVLLGDVRPGGVLFAVGDVMGHGIGSALVMASTRAVLRSSALGCGHLGQLLTHLNDLLVRDLHGQRFVSMILWLVDVRSGTACWANAGHNPAIVYDPLTKLFHYSGKDGIPLGIDQDVVYGEHTYGPIRPGQVMVLGTDGVWEAANEAGEFFGMERLLDSIRAAAGGTAREIADAVRRDLDAFRGRRQHRDDVTLVVIKVVPLPSGS
jgi:sigma-B regulation protein RsbU (phosphoserine phosphatase)